MSRRRIAVGCLQKDDDIVIAHSVAFLQLYFGDRAGKRTRYIHHRLFTLQGNQRVFNLDLVAGLDIDIDNGDFLNIAKIGYRDLLYCHKAISFQQVRG